MGKRQKSKQAIEAAMLNKIRAENAKIQKDAELEGMRRFYEENQTYDVLGSTFTELLGGAASDEQVQQLLEQQVKEEYRAHFYKNGKFSKSKNPKYTAAEADYRIDSPVNVRRAHWFQKRSKPRKNMAIILSEAVTSVLERRVWSPIAIVESLVEINAISPLTDKANNVRVLLDQLKFVAVPRKSLPEKNRRGRKR